MPEKLETLLSNFPEARLKDVYGYWNGGGRVPTQRKALIAALGVKMASPKLIGTKTKELGRKLGDLLDHFLEAPGFERSLTGLRRKPPMPFLTPYELDAALGALEQRGFLVRKEEGARKVQYFVPRVIGQTLVDRRNRETRGIQAAITLQGFLERRFAANGGATAEHRRQAYKLLSGEKSILGRIQKLAPDLQDLVTKVIQGFGGILPESLFNRLALGPNSWDGPRWKRILENNSLGTVRPLSLGRYGINHNEKSLILFHEVSLAYLREHALSKKKGKLQVVEMGVDLVSNINRFITFVLENPVKFTLKGDIFRTTERKITDDFLKEDCKELPKRDILHFIYQFALNQRLIDRTGERTFVLSPPGRDWENASFSQRMGKLVEYICEEKDLPGEYYHQVRLRKSLLRWLKRMDPEVWYDAMSLPLLARNSYLSRLDHFQVAEVFSARSPNDDHATLEDLQQMAWNLFAWVRTRLHPLGIIDLAYDRTKRPVSIRLSRLGWQVLHPEEEGSKTEESAHLVVNPDFEVVLFPGSDPYEVIHLLDRFCIRTKSDRLFHYQLTEESVRRALAEGIALKEILEALHKHSRVPVPQNVQFSIRDWAAKGGLFLLGKRNRLTAQPADLMDRFASDPRVKPWISSRPAPDTLVLKRRMTPPEIRNLVLELGFFIDLP